MDGRRPVGIMYTNTNVDDPAKEIEYNQWYHDVHFPDVTEPGIFVNATMFHNVFSPPRPGEGKFLAFYECYWQDLDGAYAEFTKTVAKLRTEHRIHAGTARAFYGVYRQLTIVSSTDRRKRTQSLLAVRIDAQEPSKEADVKRWYTETHVPEVVELGLYHTGSFGELITGEPFRSMADPGQPRFLAVYESDIGDPQWLAGEVGRRFSSPGVPDYVQIDGASMFYRVSPW